MRRACTLYVWTAYVLEAQSRLHAGRGPDAKRPRRNRRKTLLAMRDDIHGDVDDDAGDEDAVQLARSFRVALVSPVASSKCGSTARPSAQ